MTSTVSPNTPVAATSTPQASDTIRKKPTAEAVRLVLESQAIKDALKDISKLTGELATEGKRMAQLLEDIQKTPENKTLQKEVSDSFTKIMLLVLFDSNNITSNPLIDSEQFRKNLVDIRATLKAFDAR